MRIFSYLAISFSVFGLFPSIMPIVGPLFSALFISFCINEHRNLAIIAILINIVNLFFIAPHGFSGIGNSISRADENVQNTIIFVIISSQVVAFAFSLITEHVISRLEAKEKTG